MKKRLVALANRRRMLVEEIQAQRMVVADIAQDLQRPLALADTGLKVVGFIRDHPGLVAAGFAALLSLRGKSIAGLALKGWRLLYLYPAALSFGLKSFLSKTRSPDELRNPEADH